MKTRKNFDSEKYCNALFNIVDCRTAKAVIKGELSDEKVNNLFKNLEYRKSSFCSLKELVDWCNDYLTDWKVKKVTQKELKEIVEVKKEVKQEELFKIEEKEEFETVNAITENNTNALNEVVIQENNTTEETQEETVETTTEDTTQAEQQAGKKEEIKCLSNEIFEKMKTLDNANVTSKVFSSPIFQDVNADEREHATEETESTIAENATVATTLDNSNITSEVATQEEIKPKGNIETQETQATQAKTLDNSLGKIYGYARVSTEKQNLNRQLTNLCKYDPSIEIYQEKFSGRKVDNRQEFKKLLARVRKGDCIVFDSVSRMSRNASEGFKLYKELYNKGISLVFLNESYINTSVYEQSMRSISCPFSGVSSACSDSATEKFINTVCTAIQEYTLSLIERQIVEAFNQSEKEVVDISSRIKQGIRERASKGLPIGNHTKHRVRKDKEEKKAKIRALSRAFGGQFTDIQIIEMLHVSSITLWKYKAEIKQDIEKE